MNRKVTVVGGAGNVGATVARGVADKQLADVVVIDIADKKAEGTPGTPPTGAPAPTGDRPAPAPIPDADKPATGVDSITSAEGAEICWG